MKTNVELTIFCNQVLRDLGATRTTLEVTSKLKPNVFGMTLYSSSASRSGSGSGSRPKILINANLAKESDKTIKTIVVHELAHVLLGPSRGANHGPQWYAVANKLSRAVNGYRVTENVADGARLSDSFWKANYKYVYRCKRCGTVIGFNDPSYSYESAKVIGSAHRGCGGLWEKME